MAIKGLDAWVERLGKREMPVLANVVKELNELTGDDDTEVNQLSDVILKDANLTSQVLRIANSVQYNLSSYPINTVSRAIVLIGFRGVRAICISVMVIDSLLGKKPRERLLEQMAQAFHAAVQSRQLVRKTNEDVQEEVFIAGLLYHLGEMAFWSMGGAAVEELDQLLKNEKLPLREATEQVLGCSFKGISRTLAETWNLGDTLVQALYPTSSSSPKVQAVCLGVEISRAAKQGWDSPEMVNVIHKVSRLTGLSYLDAQKSVEKTADEAAEVALTYGAAQICHLIPSRQRKEIQAAERVRSEPLKANPELQLSVLRDLSNALLEGLDVNSIFQMVLEGLHRGIGLERVALAFVQKGRVTAKFTLGEGSEIWREKFDFSVAGAEQNIFTHLMKVGEPLWLKREEMVKQKHLYSPAITKLFGDCPAFAAGVFIGPRCIAIFYADRWNQGGKLDNELFQSFRHFMLQTQMSLRMLSEKRLG